MSDRVMLSEAKHLYDNLRDPHLHWRAAQVSLALRESRLGRKVN